MEIKNLRTVNEPYAKCRFTVDLDKQDLAKLEKLVLNFCTINESKGREWVNVVSLKHKDGPEEGKYEPVVKLVGFDMGQIKEKVNECARMALNGLSEDSVSHDDAPF